MLLISIPCKVSVWTSLRLSRCRDLTGVLGFQCQTKNASGEASLTQELAAVGVGVTAGNWLAWESETFLAFLTFARRTVTSLVRSLLADRLFSQRVGLEFDQDRETFTRYPELL